MGCRCAPGHNGGRWSIGSRGRLGSADPPCASAEAAGDQQRGLDARQEHINDLRKLRDLLTPDPAKDAGNSGDAAVVVIRLWLADARARKASAAGNAAEEIGCLREALPCWELLQKADELLYRVGVGNSVFLPSAFEKAVALQIELARATRDLQGERRAREKHLRWLAQRLQLTKNTDFAVMYDECRPGILLQCLYATEAVELQGKSFYEGRMDR